MLDSDRTPGVIGTIGAGTGNDLQAGVAQCIDGGTQHVHRAIAHEVVDFLQFDFGLFIFPDFNVADSAIVVGVGLLLLDVVIHDSEDSAGPSPSSEPDGEGLADGAGPGSSGEA